MQFRITKTIISHSGKQGKLTGILILIFILPVAIILLVPVLLFMLFVAIANMFKSKPSNAIVQDANMNLLLVSNSHVSIALVEDETDAQYRVASDVWSAKVFDDLTAVYRASTTPEIPGLHGQFITNFIKETDKGAFLQLVEYNPHRADHISSRLIFLQYSNLSITSVSNIGPYQLLEDKHNPALLKGFNRYEQMEFTITYRDH